MLELIVILIAKAVIALIETFIFSGVLALMGVSISFKILFAIIFLMNLFFRE